MNQNIIVYTHSIDLDILYLYFFNLRICYSFQNTPCTSHPIVLLAGVNASDLEALLEFVYRGEVSVDHSQLPSLLQAAHCLNIQGLAPQTVTKDDYNTTSIQLHPSLLAQHHVKAVIDVGNGNMVGFFIIKMCVYKTNMKENR